MPSTNDLLRHVLSINNRDLPMIKQLLLRGLVLPVLLGMLAPAAHGSEPELSKITVVGHGGTLWEARNDAIRQALQQAMRQLVVADRTIENDSVLRDRVMSTMNGYVDNFETIKITGTGGEVAVEARISLSASRIENFLASPGKASSVQGNLLAANLQAETLARTARAQIFWRLLSPYPTNAFDIDVRRVDIDQQRPGFLKVEYVYSTDRQFLQSLRGGIKALSKGPGIHLPTVSDSNSVKRYSGSWLCMQPWGNLGGEQAREDCLQLPAGAYGAELSGLGYRSGFVKPDALEFAIDLVDNKGQSLLIDDAFENSNTLGSPTTKNGFLQVWAGPLGVISDNLAEETSVRLWVYKSEPGVLMIPTSAISDMTRLARVVIIAFGTGGLCNEKPMMSTGSCGNWSDITEELQQRANIVTNLPSK